MNTAHATTEKKPGTAKEAGRVAKTRAGRWYAFTREEGDNGKEMQRLGWSTTRAYINPADFGAWCRVRELNLNAEARNQFANSVALDAARSME